MIAEAGAYVATSTLEAESSDLHFVQLKDKRPDSVQRYLMNDMLIVRVGKWKVRVIEVMDDAAFDAQGLDAPGWHEWKNTQSSK